MNPLIVTRKTKFKAYRIQDENDLDDLIVNNFDDNFDIRIYKGRVRLSNPDFVETFRLGDWCILDGSLRMNFVDNDFFLEHYETRDN